MLNGIIDALIVKHNVRKIAPKGNLHSTIENGPSYGSSGEWQGFPCYSLDFLFNDYEIISYVGGFRDFPPEKISRYRQGFFVVAVDTARLVLEAQRRNCQEDFRNERICFVGEFNRTELTSVSAKNIIATAKLWNQYYGFKADYDGFTVGNALD